MCGLVEFSRVGRAAEVGRRLCPSASMVSAFEARVNNVRGYACLLITVLSVGLGLNDLKIFFFWRDDAYAANTERTGVVGLATSLIFLAYLLVDSLVGILCRAKFRRSMNAVLLHHVVVGIGVLAFLLPSPPRGFFLYVWGEALTACRLLPPGPRWHARTAVFAFRRALWLFLVARDIAFFQRSSQVYGVAAAIVPPCVALLLLALDAVWWREHARSVPRAAESRRSSPSSLHESGEVTTDDDNDRHHLLHKSSPAQRATAASPQTVCISSAVDAAAPAELRIDLEAAIADSSVEHCDTP